jgi:hypothetical protein
LMALPNCMSRHDLDIIVWKWSTLSHSSCCRGRCFVVRGICSGSTWLLVVVRGVCWEVQLVGRSY